MENCFLKYGMVLEKRSGKKVESKFFLDNVKALASGEGSGGFDCCNTCSGVYCGYFIDPQGTGTKLYYK